MLTKSRSEHPKIRNARSLSCPFQESRKLRFMFSNLCIMTSSIWHITPSLSPPTSDLLLLTCYLFPYLLHFASHLGPLPSDPLPLMNSCLAPRTSYLLPLAPYVPPSSYLLRLTSHLSPSIFASYFLPLISCLSPIGSALVPGSSSLFPLTINL